MELEADVEFEKKCPGLLLLLGIWPLESARIIFFNKCVRQNPSTG